jgi:hypothetical protein
VAALSAGVHSTDEKQRSHQELERTVTRSSAEGTAMLIVEAELLPLYDALHIAVGYLVRSGYGLSEANERASLHIVNFFNAGERRALMLANRAISMIEKERVEEDKRRSAALSALFKGLG